jgi:hypothetical protein
VKFIASVSVYLASEDQVTHVSGGHAVTERHASLLISGEVGNGYCDALLSVKEEQRLGFLRRLVL